VWIKLKDILVQMRDARFLSIMKGRTSEREAVSSSSSSCFEKGREKHSI
jgi:hypothetical protein